MTDPRARLAFARAEALVAEPATAAQPAAVREGQRWARIVAIGDPQASAAHVFAMIAHHKLLGDDGFLRPDVRVVSMGDHFDYADHDGHSVSLAPREPSRDGLRVLSWLAAHSPAQVTILLGNHDACRVMEMSEITDARIAEARAAVAAGPITRDDWARRFSEMPKADLLLRDYASITVAQRTLVQRLLLDGRLVFAATGVVGGRTALFTHAGVTTRERDLLDISSNPAAFARALNDLLARAVDTVRADWEAGRSAALSLAPVYVGGAKARDDASTPEGGGVLYHRPHDPDREGRRDATWDANPDKPRRFDPRTLPQGFVQVVGHTGHARCVKELARWCEGTLREHESLRTIVVGKDDSVSYRAGVHVGPSALIMTDPELNKRRVEDIELLELDHLN